MTRSATGPIPFPYMLMRQPEFLEGTKRVQPRAGDVFVFRLGMNECRWGRVIATDFELGDGHAVGILIYLYDVATRTEAAVPWAEMTRDNLLVGPIVTNPTPWRSGYFKTVAKKPLEAADRLELEFFISLSGDIRDANGQRVETSVAPGIRHIPNGGLFNVRLLDSLFKLRFGVPDLRDNLEAWLLRFCATHSVKPPRGPVASVLALFLDEGASDSKLEKYLRQCFGEMAMATRGLMIAEIRRESDAYQAFVEKLAVPWNVPSIGPMGKGNQWWRATKTTPSSE